MIYSKGRSSPGKIITNAPPGLSAHNYGLASDWTIFDEMDQPIFITKDNPRWKEYENACLKAGLRWGGEFTNLTDFYHNELKIKAPWKDVKRVYDESGIEKAYEFIKDQMGGF